MEKFKKWAGIILKHNKSVLMCKRSPEKSMPNVWSIPSGHVESGESPGHGAIREFYEETNIELDSDIDFIGFVNKYKKDGVKKGHMFVFLKETETKMEPDLKNAKDGFEHTDCKYFELEDLPESEENKEMIDLIKKILK